MDHSLYLILACLFGFFMAWGVGANDVANAMGTSVGSKALTLKQAIIIAAIFEFAGAYLAGGAVTQTISKGIVDTSFFQGNSDLFVYGMLASLLAAGVWLLVASNFGWPVSTTHTIIGAIVGFTAVGISPEAVHWNKIGSIVLSWITSPLLGGVIAYFLFISAQYSIFAHRDRIERAKRFIPYYIFLASFVIAASTLTKGLAHVNIGLSPLQSALIVILFSFLMMLIGKRAMNRLKEVPAKTNRERFAHVEKAFAVLMGFTACAMAFAHGSNDVANAVGPIAAIYSVVTTQEGLNATVHTPSWILLLGGIGIIVGLVTYGHKVIATVGSGITELTPSRGFAATLGAATTVIIASTLGLPISTTHTLVGAVLGVGLARGIGALNLGVIQTIITSWLVTLPAGAILAIIFFYLLRWLL